MLESWRGTVLETDEIEPRWFGQDAIPFDKMWDDARYWLPRVLAGEAIEGWFVFNDSGTAVIDWKIEQG